MDTVNKISVVGYNPYLDDFDNYSEYSNNIQNNIDIHTLIDPCDSVNNDNLSINSWKNIFKKKDLNDDNENIEVWEKKIGKKVILLESNNPWFIKNEYNSTPSGNIEFSEYQLNTVPHKPQADFQNSKYVHLDSDSLGYGHSYKSRYNMPSCNELNTNSNAHNVIENFGIGNENGILYNIYFYIKKINSSDYVNLAIIFSLALIFVLIRF